MKFPSLGEKFVIVDDDVIVIDTFNNNNHVINVEMAEEAIDDDDLFNTSFVEHSLVSAATFSKSMNDIYAENKTIPQVGNRPMSLVFDCNETFFSVSISC